MLSSSSFSTDGNNNSHEDNKDQDRHLTLDHRHHGGGHHLSPASYQLPQYDHHELIPHQLQPTVSSHLRHEDQNHHQMRQLLISCAELVSQSDFSAAHRLVSLLSTSSTPFGDSTERLVHQFSKALSLRINRHHNNTNTATANFIRSNLLTDSDHHHHHQYYSAPIVAGASASAASRTTSTISMVNLIDNPSVSTSASDAVDLGHHQIHELHNDEVVAIDHDINNDNHGDLQSSYLYLNRITPFIRFSHLTANQAILEAIEGQESIHILDFDTMQGVQWPPLMQAIADRYYTSSSLSSSDTTPTSSSLPHPPVPPMIRITGTGQDIDTLRKTGDRLQRFAQSLGLRFQFHPLILLLNDPSSVALQLPSAIALLPHETLAVNCVLYLHKLLSSRDDDDDDDDHHDQQYYNQQQNTTRYYYSSSSSRRDDDDGVCLFLRTIKSMNPKVVTVAEREASNNHPNFMKGFVEALDHYTALFNSLEATLPPNSQERLTVEQVWFGREIADIVSAEGEERRERHERLESYWVEKLTSSGFTRLPLSPYALSQAKLLLRLHYPSEGYQLQILNDSFFLGWQNQSLFTVSSWY